MKFTIGLKYNKVSTVKKWLSEIRRGETGLILPIVLVMLALGSLLIVPSLNYVSTSLKTGEMVEKNVKGLYAAEAGIEDALWKLLYDNDVPTPLPYPYQVTNVNGMTVYVVIDLVGSLFDEETGPVGDHSDWLLMTKTVNYDAGIYYYTLSITNSGVGNMKVEMILIDFPSSLEYVTNSTGGDITTDTPEISGSPTTGISLVWDIPVPHPTIEEEGTGYHTFQLSGPPDVPGVEGHGFVRTARDDVGTVWDGDSYPYKITAEAKDAGNTVVATIRAGAWMSSQLCVSCWDVNPEYVY